MALEPELVTLGNGVRIALDPMEGLQTAALGVWIGVGARWESPREAGVAHLFEHMAFKGGGDRDARALAESIEAVGGSFNAATGYERTAYYSRMLSEHAGFALDLIADIIRAPRWTQEEFEREKGVVEQEMGEARDTPDDRVFELHQQAVFPDQPLGRPILGTPESLSNLKLDDLAAFQAAHLKANNVVLSVAGGYDRAAILDVAERRFGDLPGDFAPLTGLAKPVSASATEVRKLEQTHLVFSWGAPAAGSDDLYPVRLLTEILGGGMASRLFQDVREARGLVYTIDAFLDAYLDVGRLGVYAACTAKNAAAVANLVADALLTLARTGPTPAELARAKAVSAAQLLIGAEGPPARAEARASQTLLKGRLLSFAEIRAKVEAVTAEEVREAARQAASSPASAALIGPRGGQAAAQAFVARFV